MATTTRLRSLLWVPVLAFCVLYLLMLFFKWRPIENDISTRVDSTLDTAGYDWVDVSLADRGREVLLTGEMPQGLDQAQIELLAKEVYGVNTVTSRFTVREAVASSIETPPQEPIVLRDPDLSLSLKDGQLFLQGELASQADIDNLLAKATAIYGVDNVVHNLRVADDVAKLEGTDDLLAMLPSLGANGEIVIRQGSATVVGVVTSDEQRPEVLGAVANGLPPNYQLEDKLVVAPPPEPEIAEPQEEPPVVAEVPTEEIDSLLCGRVLSAFLKERSIYFGYNKAEISVDSYPLLDNLAKVVGKCPEALFEIGGHTDTIGNKQANKWLSEARAKAVADYLEGAGVDGARIVAVGYGEEKPIASNATSEGRAKNRRIEFTVKQ